MFSDFLRELTKAALLSEEESSTRFVNATRHMINYVDSESQFIDLLEQIGTIPESIAHDSTEEKLFAKASDAVLARAFRELGLKARVITERADAADVIIESKYHGYSLVADAKAFRLSRTAKNQKDFKVTALSGWRQDANYAVLCSPFFQYPSNQSQIYAQSIDYNVCLLSWEHLIFLIKNNVIETEHFELSKLWTFGEHYSKIVSAADRKKCFLRAYNQYLADYLNRTNDDIQDMLKNQIRVISNRAVQEIGYWENVKKKIHGYSREQAIEKLVSSMKIDEKIGQISTWRLFS
jgi:type II restriction enzyme